MPGSSAALTWVDTKGNRSERSEESEHLPQADRNSTRVRIAKRDGEAGETDRARQMRHSPASLSEAGLWKWSRRVPTYLIPATYYSNRADAAAVLNYQIDALLPS
jgi:hypothetical protein